MSKEDRYIGTEEEDEGMDILDKLEVETLIRETEEFLADDELSEKALETTGWGEKSAEKFGKTIGISPKEHGFIDKCIIRMKNKKGWDEEKAGGFCAKLVDITKGTTKWRGKSEY